MDYRIYEMDNQLLNDKKYIRNMKDKLNILKAETIKAK
jgi:hypothetical protein